MTAEAARSNILSAQLGYMVLAAIQRTQLRLLNEVNAYGPGNNEAMAGASAVTKARQK